MPAVLSQPIYWKSWIVLHIYLELSFKCIIHYIHIADAKLIL